MISELALDNQFEECKEPKKPSNDKRQTPKTTKQTQTRNSHVSLSNLNKTIPLSITSPSQPTPSH